MGIDKLLENFVFITSMKVEWGDMDAFMHVNNIEYFRYFQITRMNYLNNIKADINMADMSLSTILANTQAKYIYPLKYPDTISIGTRVDKMARQYVNMQFCVVSHKHKRVATVGNAKIVTFDYSTNKKIDIPTVIRDKIINFEKEAIEIIN